MLKLVHIKNISESDTPSFTTETEQVNYFDNLVGITITDGWYPPYYENEIKFDTNDVSFDSNYNYLILYYANRRYYYFIDNMTYVNEGVISIHITMDTIQTFMFGATLSDVVIERKFINRWNSSDDTINREYIRENVSNSDLFYNEKFEYEENDPLILIKSTNKIITNSGDSIFLPSDKPSWCDAILPTTSFEISGDGSTKYYQDNATTIVVPVGRTQLLNNGQVYATSKSLDILGSGALNVSYVKDIYYLPFNPLYNNSNIGTFRKISTGYTFEPSINNISVYVGISRGLVATDHYAIGLRSLGENNTDSTKTITYSWSSVTKSIKYNNDIFYANEYGYTDFKPNFVPALIDENYIKIEYGECGCFTSYPLSKAVSTFLICKKTASLSDGTRYYYICGNEEVKDVYKTMVSTEYGTTYDLTDNQWLNYKAQNKGRLLSSIASIGVGIAVGYATKNVKAGFVAKDLTQLALKPDYKDFRTNPLRNKTKGARKIAYTIDYEKTNLINKAEETEQLDKLGVIANTANAINGIIGERANAYFMPNTSRSNGDISSDILSNSNRIYFRQEVVEDINQVAQYYHRNGYLVNEYVKYELGLDALLNNNNTRAYYNIIKLSMCSVHLNTLEAQDIIDDIERRLQNGFRYWNLSSRISIGTFQYDNVEKEYLQ